MRFRPLELGLKRTKTWFAWWPVTCREGDETRWLERVTVEQETWGTSMMGEPSHGPGKWMNLRFVDKEENNVNRT